MYDAVRKCVSLQGLLCQAPLDVEMLIPAPSKASGSKEGATWLVVTHWRRANTESSGQNGGVTL